MIFTKNGKGLDVSLTGTIWPGMFEEWKANVTDKPEFVNLEICSEGGSVIDAFALYNALKSIGNVTATVTGWAASAATIVLMAADRIRMHSNSFLMIHEPSLCLWEGNLTECRKAAGVLELMRDTIAEAYAKRSSMDLDTLKEMMRDETWMSAEEAQNAGFCDEILDAVEIAAKANVPENLKEKIMGKKTVPTNEVGEEQKPPCQNEEPAKETTETETTETLKETTEEKLDPGKPEPEEDPLKELEKEAEELRKQVETLTTENEELRKQCECKDAELKTIKDRAEKIRAGLKVQPKDETAASTMEWNEALKACGGDYVTARKKYPESFRKLMEKNR